MAQQIKVQQDNVQNNVETKIKKFQHWQLVRLFLAIYDIIAVNAAYFLALWVRFDCRFSAIPENYWEAYTGFAPIYTILAVGIFSICKLYNSIWRFASYSELLHCAASTVLCFLVQLVGINTFYTRMPVSYHIFGIVGQAVLIIGVRFTYRLVLLLGDIRDRKTDHNGKLDKKGSTTA